jgi:hypoxanthine phosphoribosyltransferase
MVMDLINKQKFIDIKNKYPNSIIAPVHAFEGKSLNKIPIVYAEVMSSITGFEVDKNIIQINDVSRTNKTAIERLISREKFEGNVIPGKNYIILDDVVTQGGTLSEFRSYIESNGGKVVAASTLGYTQYSTVLAVKNNTISDIERRFGRDETESFLREFKIAEKIENLTNGEAKYILSFKSLDHLRKRISETLSERNSQRSERSYREKQETKITEKGCSYNYMNIFDKVKFQYTKNYPAIAHIQEKTALIIDKINTNAGHNLSIDEIKDMYKVAGKKLEGSYSKSDKEDFKILKEVFEDLRKSELIESKHIAQQKTIHKLQNNQLER